MFTFPSKVVSIITALVLVGGGAWAAAIEGIVLDQKGLPLKGADVRLERSGGGTWKQVVKTDDKGHYTCGNLEAGAIYRVSLAVNNTVKASITNVKTRVSPAVAMNFNLQTDKSGGSATVASSSSKKKTHRVWAPGETGSNLGGRWVEVEGDGVEPSVNNVKKASGDSVRSMQMGSR